MASGEAEAGSASLTGAAISMLIQDGSIWTPGRNAE